MRFKSIIITFSLVILWLGWYAQVAISQERQLLIRDEETESVIWELTKPILQAARVPQQSVSIYLLNQSEPNAFAAGGQNIFISTGLLSFSDNPDALVGVIAHEIGHITGGHLIQYAQAMKRFEGQMLLGLIATAAIGLGTKSLDAAVGTLSGTQSLSIDAFMAFNRAQENAADSTSVRILKQLKVSNLGITQFLHSLSTAERTFYNDLSTYERTHPISKSRIEFIKANLPEESVDSYITPTLRDRYRLVHAKIFAFTHSPIHTLNHFHNNTSQAAQYARAIAYFRQHNKEAALRELNPLVQAHPNSPYFIELKGQILYELGFADEAIEFYYKAHQMKPSSDLLTLQYCEVLLHTKHNVNQTVKLLTQLTSKQRNEAHAWHLLGKAYRVLGDNNNMHIALAYDSYLRGDTITARKHINAIQGEKLKSYAVKDLKALIKEAEIEKEHDGFAE